MAEDHPFSREFMMLVYKDTFLRPRWEEFAKTLGLNDATVHDIKTRNRTVDGIPDPAQCLYSALDHWTQEYSFKATPEKMWEHLIDFGAYHSANRIGFKLGLKPIIPQPPTYQSGAGSTPAQVVKKQYIAGDYVASQINNYYPPFNKEAEAAAAEAAGSKAEATEAAGSKAVAGSEALKDSDKTFFDSEAPEDAVVNHTDLFDLRLQELNLDQDTGHSQSDLMDAIPVPLPAADISGNDPPPKQTPAHPSHIRPASAPISSPEGIEGNFSIGSISFNKKKGLIAKGNLSTIVCRGRYQDRDAVIKRITIDSDTVDENEMRDMIVKKLEHRNIIRYFGFEKDDNFLYIALEECSGSLEDLVDKINNLVGIQLIKDKVDMVYVFGDVVTGLVYLHSLQPKMIIHRDMKPQNVLLKAVKTKTGDSFSVVAVLADFGSAKERSSTLTTIKTTGTAGTVGYLSPEHVPGKNPTPKDDVFGTGCTMAYSVTNGKHPFGKDGVEQQLSIKQKKANAKIHEKDMVCAAAAEKKPFRSLLLKMIEKNPVKRPGASDVLADKLFTNYRMKRSEAD